MNKKIVISIIIAVVAIAAAIIVYYFFLRKPKKEEQQDGAELYEVTTAETVLNVRKEADANAEKIGTLERGSIVNVSKIENGFGYLPTYKGWASMQYLTKQK